MFELVSEYKPSGDQPKAIEELVEGLKEGKREQGRSRNRRKQGGLRRCKDSLYRSLIS